MMQRVLIFLLAATLPAYSMIVVTSPTTSWVAVPYANPANADPAADHQTGIRDADIVGDADNPSFYTAFDDGGTPGTLTDGSIGFRLRVAGDKNPSGFESAFWVGIDVNLDGEVDLFAGGIEGDTVGLYATGDSENISPSTTSIETNTPFYETLSTSQNYAFQEITSALDPSATNLNLDNGSGGSGSHVDHFVSFVIPFAELVSAVTTLGLNDEGDFDETKGLQYVTATSNNRNSLNQDLNGIAGGLSSTTTWTELGGFSTTYSASGNAVPEPGVTMLGLIGVVSILLRRRRS